MTPSDADTPLTTAGRALLAQFRSARARLTKDYPIHWLDAADIIEIEREAAATLDAARASPAPAGLDVERLGRALWAWGFDATGPVIRDEVRGPTDSQRRMARKLAAEYARLTPPVDRDAPREGT